MIKIIFKSLQLFLGTNQLIFHLFYNKYEMLAHTSWISHLWEMSCKYDVTIDGHYKKLQPT